MKSFFDQVPPQATHIWDGVFCAVIDGDVKGYDLSTDDWYNTPFSRDELYANATQINPNQLAIDAINEYAKVAGVDVEVAVKMILMHLE